MGRLRTSRSTRTRRISRRGRNRPARAAASSPSTSPTRRIPSSSRSSRRCPAPTTARARTRSRSTRRPSRATSWRSTTSRCDGQRRRRLRPLRRQRPGQPGDPRAGRRRPVARPRSRRGRSARSRRTRRRPEQRALDLHLAGRRPGLRGDRRQHGALRRRHLRHHRPDRTRSSSPTSISSSSRSTRASTSRTTSRHGDTIFNHDMVVKHIDGVDDHARVLLGRGLHQAQRLRPGQPGRSSATRRSTTRTRWWRYPGTGEGWAPPEGNGHQAEFSHDNKFVLAADEDFNQYRLIGLIDPGGPDHSRLGLGGIRPRDRCSGQRQRLGATPLRRRRVRPATIPLRPRAQRSRSPSAAPATSRSKRRTPKRAATTA